MRTLTVALTATLATAGLLAPAVAATAAPATARAAVTAAPRIGYFHEEYRGRDIEGWGRDEKACAFIDGIELTLLPRGGDRYLSTVHAYEDMRGVRAITRASVRSLGDDGLLPPEVPAAHCRK